MTYSLIIPVYNEQNILPLLINKLKTLDKKIEIIIINDGSNDNTSNILKENNSFIIVENKTNKGKGASVIKGLRFAMNKNIILIDGDLEIDIDQIPRLINEYEKNKIKVLSGKRWNKDEGLNFEINRIGNYLINNLFNLLYKTNLNDVLCCVKIIDKNLLKSLNLKSMGFSIEIETISKLIMRDINIDEIYVNYKRRTIQQGKKLKISDAWQIIKMMIILKLSTEKN